MERICVEIARINARKSQSAQSKVLRPNAAAAHPQLALAVRNLLHELRKRPPHLAKKKKRKESIQQAKRTCGSIKMSTRL